VTSNFHKADKIAEDILLRMGDVPFCPVCDNPIREDGPCRFCEQEKAERIAADCAQRERDISRLGGLMAYEDFTATRYDNKAALAACEGFPDVNLYIYGAAGTGKSHLATAVARQSPDAFIVKPQAIYRSVRGNGRQGADAEEAAIMRYVNARALVIDDLGVDKKTDYSLSVLYEIIDGRIMARRSGLIITSNLSLDELAARLADDRISSRIAGSCRLVEIKGNDRRITK
jgi:DNA replication protein DnaC